MRIPAKIEPPLIGQIASLVADPIALCNRLVTPVKADCTNRILDAGQKAAERLRAGSAAIGVTSTNDDQQPIVLEVSAAPTRGGGVQRLVLEGDRPAVTRAPDVRTTPTRTSHLGPRKWRRRRPHIPTENHPASVAEPNGAGPRHLLIARANR